MQAMKKTIVTFLLFSMLLSTAHTIVPFFGYLLHHSHIIDELCVKKDLPDEENDCQGFCFLKKQLSSHDEMHDSEQTSGFFSPVLFSFIEKNPNVPVPERSLTDILNYSYSGIELDGYERLVTQPPRG